jgi:hypothetical protein
MLHGKIKEDIQRDRTTDEQTKRQTESEVIS